MLDVTVCLIYVPDHHHAASLLFAQRYRDCFWYYVTDPILNFVRKQQMCVHDGILRLLLQQAAAAACSKCHFHRQPGGQQQY